MVEQQSTGSDTASHPPGSEAYARATSPHNTVAIQRPAVVAAPTTTEEVAASVRLAAEHGLRVVPQATGHGAAGALGDEVMLLDTSGLDSIEIDPDRRRARVGAGSQWGSVNQEAAGHGLLGRAGSAPDVGVTGYTFGAGVGWLTRPHGLASSALRAVTYVDGTGEVRRAADDAEDQVDRDAIWACRGGGGVGIAVSLEFDLVPIEDLYAGLWLWPVEHLASVVQAWTDSLAHVGPALSTSIAILQAPPAPLIPEHLHGHRVVHLAAATVRGELDARPLLDALARLEPAALDTFGPAAPETLGRIHLDPVGPVPALGRGRWLDESGGATTLAFLRAAAGQDRIIMAEVRHVANDAPTSPGALSRAPGSFMAHAVGGPDDDGGAVAIDAALDVAFAPTAGADVGLAIGSWSDGRAHVPDALPADVRARVAEVADAVDPDHLLARSPLLSDGAP